MSRGGVWLADSHCCGSRCVCHFSISLGRAWCVGIDFVIDYMLKNSARIENTGYFVNKKTLVISGADVFV